MFLNAHGGAGQFPSCGGSMVQASHNSGSTLILHTPSTSEQTRQEGSGKSGFNAERIGFGHRELIRGCRSIDHALGHAPGRGDLNGRIAGIRQALTDSRLWM